MITVLLVAIVTVHLRYGFSSIKLIAVTNAGPQFGPPGYETALLYIACLVALNLAGPTPLSVDGLIAWRSTLNSPPASRAVEFKNGRGELRSMPLGELMQHGANHGVHHRAQVALLFRELGYVPGNVDLLFYDAERHHVDAW